MCNEFQIIGASWEWISCCSLPINALQNIFKTKIQNITKKNPSKKHLEINTTWKERVIEKYLNLYCVDAYPFSSKNFYLL